MCLVPELVRKNIRMSKNIANWYEDRASKMGISQTALMVTALHSYMKQDDTINFMVDFKEMYASLGEDEKK